MIKKVITSYTFLKYIKFINREQKCPSIMKTFIKTDFILPPMANKMSSSDENLEGRMKKYFEVLRKNIGQKVRVEYVEYGSLDEERGTLIDVKDYSWLEIKGKSNTSGTSFPFVGYGCAIRKVLSEYGIILYENLFIPSSYDLRKEQRVLLMRALSFGRKTVERRSEYYRTVS